MQNWSHFVYCCGPPEDSQYTSVYSVLGCNIHRSSNRHFLFLEAGSSSSLWVFLVSGSGFSDSGFSDSGFSVSGFLVWSGQHP